MIGLGFASIDTDITPGWPIVYPNLSSSPCGRGPTKETKKSQNKNKKILSKHLYLHNRAIIITDQFFIFLKYFKFILHLICLFQVSGFL